MHGILETMALDVVLAGFEDAPQLGRLASALGVSEDEARRLAQSTPAVVGAGLGDSDAEALFHALRELGAKVELKPAVARQQPAADLPLPDLPLPEMAAPEMPLPEMAAPVTRDTHPTSPERPPPSQPPEPAGPEANMLDWGNTKIYWVYAAVAFTALGIWMIADPDMVMGDHVRPRRIRGVARILGLVWSRPAGVLTILIGLVVGASGYRAARH